MSDYKQYIRNFSIIAHIDQQDAIRYIILILTTYFHKAVERTQHLHLIRHRDVAIPNKIAGCDDTQTK